MYALPAHIHTGQEKTRTAFVSRLRTAGTMGENSARADGHGGACKDGGAMNYSQMFRRLESATSDCVPEVRAFVAQLKDAPIFDDDEAWRIIGDATENISSFLEECDDWMITHSMRARMEQMQLNALAQLRGEEVALVGTAARRAQLFNAMVMKQATLNLGVNDAPLFEKMEVTQNANT